ncbi:DUF6232 family protein [Streptomyces sp. NPDC006544]|uniref:DUF6232 family protein n=1 Tax=Streptomyces sp. NPDC006544 TaxID=3154583 RepID=UPI0033A56C55
MESNEAAPPLPPLPSQPPVPPSWMAAPAPAPAPTPAPALHQRQDFGESGIVLRVSKRLLWVGEAAYPLHNVVRVRTYVLKPDRGKALGEFALSVLVLAVLFYLATADSSGAGMISIVVVALFLATRLVHRLTRPDLYVMGVETSGAPAAVVTLADHAELRRLVARIVDVIEHPAAPEFSAYVLRPAVNIGQYVHNGDTANISGSGNIGVMK